jgi:hypothetical protein
MPPDIHSESSVVNDQLLSMHLVKRNGHNWSVGDTIVPVNTDNTVRW